MIVYKRRGTGQYWPVSAPGYPMSVQGVLKKGDFKCLNGQNRGCIVLLAIGGKILNF